MYLITHSVQCTEWCRKVWTSSMWT